MPAEPAPAARHRPAAIAVAAAVVAALVAVGVGVGRGASATADHRLAAGDRPVAVGTLTRSGGPRPLRARTGTRAQGRAQNGTVDRMGPVVSGLQLPLATPPAAGAQDLPSADPCPAQDGVLAGDGPSVATTISIPSLAAVPLAGPAAVFDPQPGDVPASYAGTILRPSDTTAFPGARPVVILFHGIYGDQCQMWWLAQYLAGSGYVVVTLTSPTPDASAPTSHDASYGVAIDAARSAVHFVEEPLENPFAFATDPTTIGLAGWSEGSVVASVAQGLPGMGSVRAIVALDDLRGSFLGDAGAPLTFCAPPVRAVVVPRVPALGFASDTPCDVPGSDTSPDIKLSGFERWRHAGLAAVELPLAGYSHFDYDDPTPKLVPVAVLTAAWFDRWLERDPGGLDPFTTCQLDGRDQAGALSATFRSAAYLPGLGIDSTTWARTLARRCGENPAEIGTTPIT